MSALAGDRDAACSGSAHLGGASPSAGRRGRVGSIGSLMKSSVEPLEGNKVKLYVEVEEAEFDKDIDAAFKAIAREVRLPGFRNGKAPRRLLEARIGIGPAREQALRDSI